MNIFKKSLESITKKLKDEPRDEAWSYFKRQQGLVEELEISTFERKTSPFPETQRESWGAFRHMYVSAKNTKINYIFAKKLGDLNELQQLGTIKWANKEGYKPGNEPLDRRMDLKNNAIGREIGWANKDSSKLLDEVYYALNNDKRVILNQYVNNAEPYKDTPLMQAVWDLADKAYYASKEKETNIPVDWHRWKDFTRLQPAKLDELTQPRVQGVSGAVADASVSAMNIIRPQTIQLAGKTTSWLGQLGNILSLAGQAVGAVAGVAAGTGSKPTGTSGQMSVQMGSQSFTSESFPLKHTGGKIIPQPISGRQSRGKDEVLAILRAGETVRTEAQEQELQQKKYAEFMEAVRPYLEERENKPKTIAEAYDPDNKIPCLLNKTTQDEEIIISIIAQAWKSNRLGFRNVLRYE